MMSFFIKALKQENACVTLSLGQKVLEKGGIVAHDFAPESESNWWETMYAHALTVSWEY